MEKPSFTLTPNKEETHGVKSKPNSSKPPMPPPQLKAKFKLKVHKCKCTHCDIISLVEQDGWEEPLFSCPACEREMDHMEDITIAEE